MRMLRKSVSMERECCIEAHQYVALGYKRQSEMSVL